MNKLDNEDPAIIGTANIQRIGGGVVLEAAAKNSSHQILEAAQEIHEGLGLAIDEAISIGSIMGMASGSYSRSLSAAYERFIGMRGLGYTLPMEKSELVFLRKRLIDAQKNNDQQLALFAELSEAATKNQEIIDASETESVGFDAEEITIIEE